MVEKLTHLSYVQSKAGQMSFDSKRMNGMRVSSNSCDRNLNGVTDLKIPYGSNLDSQKNASIIPLL